MVIQHNLKAMFNMRELGVTSSHRTQTQEKLSSGYAINRASDNAAGLSISEKMRRQIRGLDRSSTNARDGISLVQIADGALVEVHDMLQRGNELAVQAANGTNSESDRQAINAEIVQLKKEIDSITSRTKYNELEIFPPTGEWPRIAKINPNKAAKEALSGLSDKIADEYVPNAVNQILGTFSSLKNAMDSLVSSNGKDPYNMALNIDYIDGVSNTLAYVQAGFKSTTPQSFADGSLLMKVDKDDFPSLNLSPKDEQMLESTIGHEMMHGIMDAVFPSRMSRRDNGIEDFPEWFIEGTAQLTGGGFTTGWNDWLHTLTSGLSGADDGSKDDDIKEILTKYTVDNRVYGHGYLAAAYLGHLVSGGSDVSKESIASGINTVLQDLIDNPDDSFEDVVNSALTSSGKTVADIKDAINNGTDEGVAFVRQLGYASNGGAGSVITEDLKTGGNLILGDSAEKEDQPIRITGSSISAYKVEDNSWKGSSPIKLHVGTDADMTNMIAVKRFSMSAKALGIEDTNVLTADQATMAINDFGHAIALVSSVRSYYGAIQNRLEHTIKNLDNVVENTTASESRIRDADIAGEAAAFARDNILVQAGQATLAQANQSMSGVMVLLSAV